MAVASWMLRNRNRTTRFGGKRNEPDEYVALDLNRDPGENIREVLGCICEDGGLSESKRLNYLNAFVKLTLHINGNFAEHGYAVEEVLCCLRVCLVHEATAIRSGGFRAIRHVLKTEDDVAHFNNLLIPVLIARSVDLALKNDAERIEAMKLIRKALMLSPSNFSAAISRSLVSLANGGIEEKDRMLRVCLAILSELGTLNPDLFMASGGVAALTRNLMECQTPKIAEALCGVLLLLLDRPTTRTQASVDLHCVAAPYCDFHYRHGWMDKNRDERELRFNCSRLALLSILRSWPGILHFCSPANLSGLKAIVDVLYLDQLEVRKAVLDLLYELLGMPQPEWTDELFVALSAVDPAEPQAAWRLNEGFVAAEGRSILPHLAKTSPSISDMHLALLLYCFLENGLLGALSEVIATSDTFISVRATVLLGELLRLIHILLPPECCNITPALPDLLEYATTNSPQALAAINALQQQHKLLKRRPASYSLYLDFILQCGSFMKSSSRSEKMRKNRFNSAKIKLQQFVLRDEDLIKETNVLLHKDAFKWDWNLIRVIIKGESNFCLDMNDSTHRTFLKRLVEFYMPSMNRYSHLDLITPKPTHGYTTVGIDLIKLLVEIGDPETMKLLHLLFTDVQENIVAITRAKSAHDCLFSPQHMANTQCQSYFLFIGRLGSTREGVEMLKDLGIFQELHKLATTTNHDCYVKLIISSLDYREPGPARQLLSAVLTAPLENTRLYATQFLLVLLRAGLPHFATWGIPLLANQLADRSRSVCLSALCTLQEACEVPTCLDQLIKLNPPDLLQLGEKGLLLMIRFLSVEGGFALLNKNSFVVNEIKRWDEIFNFRYVKIIEGDTADVLTLHQRGEDGRYDKRTSSVRTASRKDLFLPPHLYGQLSRHQPGVQMLLDHSSLETYIGLILLGTCETDQEILKLKGALWAVGHFGSTIKGAEFLNMGGTIAAMVQLAQNSPVFSIRATAYYSLGLIATTRVGADFLFKLNWVCTRHDRHNRWPIIEEEKWADEKNDGKIVFGSDSERTSSDQPYTGDYCFVVGDDSTTDDEMMFLENPGSRQKSLTLPAAQTPPSGQHKRSLSESKTFEMVKSHKQRYHPSQHKLDVKLAMEIAQQQERQRNNSTTESTTSGVSSCESVLGKSVITDRIATLSPIPSSSSLSTLRQAGVKLRRHSESSRRTPSDRSTVSPAGSSSGRLTYQDRRGYETIRSIRRPFPIDELTDLLTLSLNTKSIVIKARHLQQELDNADSSITSGLSLSSLSSVQKFSMKDGGRAKGQCYMGVCLPLHLTDLFPANEANRRAVTKTTSVAHSLEVSRVRRKLKRKSAVDSSFNGITDASGRSSVLEFDVPDHKNRTFRHDMSFCLNCCRIRERHLNRVDSLRSTGVIPKVQQDIEISNDVNRIKTDVLLQIERLANPPWIKQAKQTLFHHKQKNPEIFQDLCLYSDACRMFSEYTYRLGPRRMIHELFFDLNFSALHTEARTILSEQRPHNSTKSKQLQLQQSEPVKLNCIHVANERRRAELAGDVEGNCLERFSPRSPPLSSVKEELASSESLLLCGEKQAPLLVVKTLDSLMLSFKENKFPIRERNNSTK